MRLIFFSMLIYVFGSSLALKCYVGKATRTLPLVSTPPARIYNCDDTKIAVYDNQTGITRIHPPCCVRRKTEGEEEEYFCGAGARCPASFRPGYKDVVKPPTMLRAQPAFAWCMDATGPCAFNGWHYSVAFNKSVPRA